MGLSSITLIFFLAGQVLIFPPEGRGAVQLFDSELTLPSPAFSFTLPPDLGRIESLHAGRGPTLIHVQTAHGNYEAQKKIEAILLHLHRKYGFRLLFLEGSAARFHPELLELFSGNTRLTMEALDRLAKKALVKAPELYLAQASETEAYGIEDLDSYLRNGRELRALLSKRNKLEIFIANLESRFQVLSGRHLNYELLNFIKKLDRFETSKSSSLLVWTDYLKEKAERVLGLDLSQTEAQNEWPMFLRLTKLRELERGIDLARLSLERKALLGEIRPFLQREIYQEIRGLFSTPFFKAVPPNLHTRLLFERMVSSLPENFDYEAFPQSKAFIAYLVLQSELEGERLLFEMDRLESEILEALAKTEEEKKLISLYKDLRLLGKLFRLELTSEDHEKLKKRKNSLVPFRMIHRFLELNKTSGIDDFSFDALEEINSLFKQALLFYEGTEERDQHMLQNIESIMKEKGETKALVVTGGFHSAPFEDYFTRLGYRYALITPRLTSTDGGEAYVTSILRYATHETPGFLALKKEDLVMHEFNPLGIRAEVRKEVLSMLNGHDSEKDLLRRYFESNYEKEFKKQARAENRSLAVVSPQEQLTTSGHEFTLDNESDAKALTAIAEDLRNRRQIGEPIEMDNIRPIGKGAYASVMRQRGDRWVYKYSGRLGWRNELGDTRNEQEFSEWLNKHGDLAAVTEIAAQDGDKLLIRQEVGIDLKEAIETALRKKRPDVARNILTAFFRLHKKLFSLGVIVLDGKLNNFLVVERNDGIHVVLNDFHQAVSFNQEGKFINGVDIFSHNREIFQSFFSYFLFYFWYLQVRGKHVEGGGNSLLGRLFSEEFQKSRIMPQFGDDGMEAKIMGEILNRADKGVIKREKVWQILQNHTQSNRERFRAHLVGYIGRSITLDGPIEGIRNLTELKSLTDGQSVNQEETVDYIPSGDLPPLETAPPSKTPRPEVRSFPEKGSEQLNRKILHDIARVGPSRDTFSDQRSVLLGGALEGKYIKWRPSYLATLTRDLKMPLANALVEVKWSEKFYEHPKSFYLLFTLLDDLAKATGTEGPLVTLIWDGNPGEDPYQAIHEKLRNKTSGLGPLDRVRVNNPLFIKRFKKLVGFINPGDGAAMQKYFEDNQENGIASLASNPQSFNPDVLQFVLDGGRVKRGDMPAVSVLVIRLIQAATLSRSLERTSQGLSPDLIKLIRELIPGAQHGPGASGGNSFTIAFEEYLQAFLTLNQANQAFEIAA